MSNALLIQERMKETSILSQGSGYKDNYDDVVHMKKITFSQTECQSVQTQAIMKQSWCLIVIYEGIVNYAFISKMIASFNSLKNVECSF